MGLFGKLEDALHGRSDGARERQAEKVRRKYADLPGMTPQLLEVLAVSNELDAEEQARLAVEACPPGSTPVRVMFGFKIPEMIHYATLLFTDCVLVRYREAPNRGQREDNPLGGADLPFWGVRSVEVAQHGGDVGLIFRGNDGTQDYAVQTLGSDPQVVREFCDEAVRLVGVAQAQGQAPAQNQAPAQSRAATQGQAASPRQDGTAVDVEIDSSLPVDDQLAAVEVFRQAGLPEDAYQAMVQKIRQQGQRATDET